MKRYHNLHGLFKSYPSIRNKHYFAGPPIPSHHPLPAWEMPGTY